MAIGIARMGQKEKAAVPAIPWTTSTPFSAMPRKRGNIRPDGSHGITSKPSRLTIPAEQD
jgi:hypothetical protein